MHIYAGDNKYVHMRVPMCTLLTLVHMLQHAYSLVLVACVLIFKHTPVSMCCMLPI